MKAIKIPENWTGEEATMIHDFLADVMEAIWTCHENKMVETIMCELNVPVEPPDQNDGEEPGDGFDKIPF